MMVGSVMQYGLNLTLFQQAQVTRNTALSAPAHLWPITTQTVTVMSQL